jgi:uncharacterized protein DUF4136
VRFPILVLAATAMASPVFAQKVNVDYAHQENFSKLTTYKWGVNKAQLPDQIEDSHIKHQIDRALQSKGLRRIDSGAAGLIVTYQATVKNEQQEVNSYADDPGIGWGGWGWGMGWGWGWGDDAGYSTTQVVTIHRGDLLVDMADPTSKKIVFRAIATGAFHSDPAKEDKEMNKAIEKMFKNMPPKDKAHRT